MTVAQRLAGFLERALLTAWIGGLWIAGAAVTPLLFRHLPSATAGDIAGELFRLLHSLGLLAAATALLVSRWQGRWEGVRPLLLLVMSLLTVVLLLVDQQVAALRGAPDVSADFGRWHGIAMGLYGTLCLLGLAVAGLPARRGE